jgi:hypothetical protein
MRVPLAVDLLPIKTLMRAILAGDVAKVAANAVLDVDVGLDVIVEVEVSPIGYAIY